MKNILFLVGSYKNKPSANGVCVENIVDIISPNNKVFILSEINSKDDIPYEKLDNEVEVYRYWRSIDRKLMVKNNNSKIARVLYYIQYVIMFHYWPLYSPNLVHKYVRKIINIHKKHGINTIVAVKNSIEDCIAAAIIKKKFPEIKVILYTLDAISGGLVQRIEKHQKSFMKSTKRWEKFLFDRADKIYAMQSHKTYYDGNSSEYSKYYNKIEYLDIPLLHPRKNVYAANEFSRRIVYTGTIDMLYTNINYLEKIIRGLPSCQFEFYGNISKEVQNVLCKNENAVYNGYLNREDIHLVQSKADFLLNLGSNVPCMISGKIFDYFSTGRPIIHLYDNDIDPALSYMIKYPNSILIDEREDISSNVEKLLDYTYCVKDNIEIEKIEKLFYKNTPQYNAKKLFD